MDYEKLYSFVVEQISDYASTFAATLRKPVLKFTPLQTVTPRDPNELITLSTGHETVITRRLNPQLLVFALTSIFIGTTLGALVPGKKTGPSLAAATVLVILVWIAYSCFLYLVCKVLTGRSSFLETVSLGVQLFSVIYVLSNFSALLWGILIASRNAPVPLAETLSTSFSQSVGSSPATDAVQIIPFYRLPPLGNFHLLLEYPFLLYFVVQLVLLLIYLPLAVKLMHQFQGLRVIIATAVLVVSLVPFIQYNTLVYAFVGAPAAMPFPIPTASPSPVRINSIIGKWRALTSLEDQLSKQQFKSMEFVFHKDGVESIGCDEKGVPVHRVTGRYHFHEAAIVIEFAGCNHFKPLSTYQLYLEGRIIKWQPPHFTGSMEVLHFERSPIDKIESSAFCAQGG